jgi:hypothetical protein
VLDLSVLGWCDKGWHIHSLGWGCTSWDLGCYVQNSVSLPASENRNYLIKRGVMGVYVADEMYP